MKAIHADNGIVRIVRVPRRAVRLRSVVSRETEAAQDVCSVGHSLQMVGVRAYALTNAANMVNFEPAWNRADAEFISIAMGLN